MSNDTAAADLGKTVIDVAAATVTLGAIVNVLPSIATVLSIVWLLLRIWESDTVRAWTGRGPGKESG